MLDNIVTNVLLTPAYIVSLAVGAFICLLITDKKVMPALPLFGAYIFSSAVVGYQISKGGLPLIL